MANEFINDDDSRTLKNIEQQANDPKNADVSNPSPDEQVQKGEKEPSSLQEAVQQTLDEARDTVNKDQEPPTDKAGEEEETPPGEQPVPKEGEKEEPTPEEQAALQAKQKVEDERLDRNPRFQELIKDRQEAQPMVEFAKADAAFCQQYKVTPDQRKQFMEAAALANTDPQRFVALLQETIVQTEMQLGKRLPPDLVDAVEKGEISEERAVQFNKTRLQMEAMKQEASQREQQTAKQHSSAIMETLNSWDTTQRSHDPDFKPKAKTTDADGKWELVLKEIKLSSMERPPQSQADAVKLAEEAYGYVNSLFKRLAPLPRSRRTLSINGSSTNNGDPGEAKTMAEFVARQVGKKHGVHIAAAIE